MGDLAHERRLRSTSSHRLSSSLTSPPTRPVRAFASGTRAGAKPCAIGLDQSGPDAVTQISGWDDCCPPGGSVGRHAARAAASLVRAMPRDVASAGRATREAASFDAATVTKAPPRTVVAAKSWIYHRRTEVTMAVSAWSVRTRKPTKLRARHPGLLAGDLASARSSPVSAVHEINLSFVCTPMDQDLAAPPTGRPAGATARLASQAPDSLCFVTMTTFNYLGPSFAVLLFARVHVLGVAWLRIVSAAVILAAWRSPWRTVAALDRRGRELLLAWASALVSWPLSSWDKCGMLCHGENRKAQAGVGVD